MIRPEPESSPLHRLTTQQPNRAGEAQATATFESRREAGLAALHDLRAAVATTKQGYDRLSHDAEVIAALAKLGQARLAPSPAFLAAVNEPGRFERSLARKPTFPRARSAQRSR